MKDRAYWGVYQAVDPTPWGADTAWQLYRDGKAANWYLLCYEDYILELIPGWEMEEEQKALAGSHFS